MSDNAGGREILYGFSGAAALGVALIPLGLPFLTSLGIGAGVYFGAKMIDWSACSLAAKARALMVEEEVRQCQQMTPAEVEERTIQEIMTQVLTFSAMIRRVSRDQACSEALHKVCKTSGITMQYLRVLDDSKRLVSLEDLERRLKEVSNLAEQYLKTAKAGALEQSIAGAQEEFMETLSEVQRYIEDLFQKMVDRDVSDFKTDAQFITRKVEILRKSDR